MKSKNIDYEILKKLIKASDISTLTACYYSIIETMPISHKIADKTFNQTLYFAAIIEKYRFLDIKNMPKSFQNLVKFAEKLPKKFAHSV